MVSFSCAESPARLLESETIISRSSFDRMGDVYLRRRSSPGCCCFMWYSIALASEMLGSVTVTWLYSLKGSGIHRAMQMTRATAEWTGA
jgi:hypothetical protein